VLSAAEKGVGAAAPGFSGKDDGRGGYRGSVVARVWSAGASLLADLAVGHWSGGSGFQRRPARWVCGSARVAVDPVVRLPDLVSRAVICLKRIYNF
jgi:hypothetical protein